MKLLIRCDCGALNANFRRRCGRCLSTLEPPRKTRPPARAGAGGALSDEHAADRFRHLRATVEAAAGKGKP